MFKKKFLLPSVELRRARHVGIAHIRHRLAFKQVLLQIRHLLLGTNLSSSSLGHRFLHELVPTQFEENSNSD